MQDLIVEFSSKQNSPDYNLVTMETTYKRLTHFLININCIFVDPIPYNDLNLCNKSEFFNINSMNCELCELNKNLRVSSDKQRCECNEKSKPKYDASTKLFMPQCEKCKPDSIFSKHIQNCIKCSNGFTKINNITSCKPCKDNEITVYQFANGILLNETRCLQCSNGTIPSKDATKCIPCPIFNPIINNGTIKCICNYKSVLIGDVCIPKNMFPEFSNFKSKYFLQYNSGEKYESHLFETQLKTNIYLCKLQNVTACQILANFCTLTLFSIYENSPCNLWQKSKLYLSSESSNHLPWLFYREGDANIVLNRKIIPVKYSLNPSLTVSKLNLTAVVFNLNGTVKEIKILSGSDLNLCPDLNYVKNEGLRFGINYRYECKVEAKQFFEGKITEFFIPFLQYWENGESTLYPVPVLIKNLALYKNDLDDFSNWLLVRRFFMFDKISSKSSNENEPSVLRYVKSVKMKIELRKEGDSGLIYPPLIILEYGQISKENYNRNEKIPFEFSTQYDMKNSIRRSIEIAVGVLSALMVLFSGVQTWAHSKRSGKFPIDLFTLIHVGIFSCGNLANVFFTVAFGTSVYVFVFYKGQTVVHLLLPTSEQEKIVKDFIIAAISLKFVEIISLIWHQISIDIFFIDWERPKPQDTIPKPKKSVSPFTLTSNSQQQTVSIWRSYFIANEWNEIQTMRKINPLAHILIVIFLLKVVGFENWGTLDPELHTKIPKYLKENHFSFTCRFAVGGLIYLTVYCFELSFMMGFYERYIKNPIQQFVDVCSLANISVFIMSLERYGYYIHGRSSHGFADTDMSTILKQLKREEEDLCAYRGLQPGTHNQTFSIGVPIKLRLYYNKLMHQTKSSINVDASPNKSGESSKNNNFDKIFQAYHNLNKFLSAFLEHALKDLDYDVKDKLFVETLLDLEFSDCNERGILYTDNGHSFDSVLFYGNEFCLFSFDIMLFSFILLLSDDFILTAVATLFVIEVIKTIRRYGGKRNLAQKTLIDERFLI